MARCANLEDQIFQEKNLMQEEIRKTQNLVVQKEEKSREKIEEMQKSLREIQQVKLDVIYHFGHCIQCCDF